MWFPSIFQKPGFSKRPRFSAPAIRRPGLRLELEQLEDRTLPSTYYAATASDLIADINAANNAGGTNTIVLTAPTTSPYVLTAVDNTADGPTGLPVIATKDNLTIVGNGDSIERSAASGTTAFRLFDVAKSNAASLTLQNLTLQNGLAFGSASSAEGGAIFNQATLVLDGVRVQGNIAQGSDGTRTIQGNKVTVTPGNGANGGGIWSNSSLTLENGTLVQNNQAIGGNGVFEVGQFPPVTGSAGGDASGGGIYVAVGTAHLTSVTISNNSALGGQGEYPGSAYGGGLYLDPATVTLSGDTVDGNLAEKGPVLQFNSSAGGLGGGVFVAAGTVTLTNDNVQNNVATGFDFAAGGGLFIEGGTVILSDDTVESNSGAVYGGGICIFGGKVTLSNDTVKSNSAEYDGGIYIYGATVTLCNDVIQSNTAFLGGGLYVEARFSDAPVVYLGPFTVANTINNTDSSGLNGPTANIDGTYILQNC